MAQEHAATGLSDRAVASVAILCGILVGAADCVGIIISAALYVGRVAFTLPVNSAAQGRYLGASTTTSPGASPRGVMIQVAVVGEARVGKTTVIKLFLRQSQPDPEKPTVGMDLHFKTLWLGQQKAWLQVWDTSGAADNNRELSNKLTKAHGCVMVYNQEDPATCAALETWRSQVLGPALEKDAGYPIAVLGNRPAQQDKATTTKQRSVPCENGDNAKRLDAAAFCKQHGIAHFQMDSSDDVEAPAAAFHHVIQSAMQKLCTSAT